jgi:hypothetical protein
MNQATNQVSSELKAMALWGNKKELNRFNFCSLIYPNFPQNSEFLPIKSTTTRLEVWSGSTALAEHMWDPGLHHQHHKENYY